MGVRLCLAAVRPAGRRVREVAAVPHRGAQPQQAAFRDREQWFGVLVGQAPPASLGQDGREQQGGLHPRAGGRQMRPGVPHRAGDTSALRPRPSQLRTGQGAQCPGGEAHPQGQGHTGRPESLGGGEAAAPGDARRGVGVAWLARVAQEQRPEVVHGDAEQGFDPCVIARGLRRSPERCGAASAWGGSGGGSPRWPDPRPVGPLQPHLELDAAGAAGRHLQLPAEQPRRCQRVLGRWFGRDDRVQTRRGPAHAAVVDAGGEFGPRVPGGGRAELREIGAEGDFDRQPEGANSGAVQGDAFGAVGVAQPLHGDGRIRPRIRRRTHRAHETGLIRAEKSCLHRQRLRSRDTQSAPGQGPPARTVETVEPLAGELTVFGGDGQGGHGHTDQRRVDGLWLRATRAGPSRCGWTAGRLTDGDHALHWVRSLGTCGT